MRGGVFPSLEHVSVRFGMRFATVLGVGTSRGQSALFALARFPGAKLIRFEPLPEARETARKVLAGHDVELHGVALGSSRGQTTLHVSAQDDSSSLLPIGSQQVTAFPGTQESHEIVVAVDVLDAYLDESTARPCLLKIDVQGNELDALRGAVAGLAHVDEILVEVSFVELDPAKLWPGESFTTSWSTTSSLSTSMASRAGRMGPRCRRICFFAAYRSSTPPVGG